MLLDGDYEPDECCPNVCGPAHAAYPECFDDLWAARPWSWQLLPNNRIYTSYLARPKESRIGSSWYKDSAPDPLDPNVSNGWLWDTTLGGRASVLRYGADTVLHPQGFEVQIEGAAFVRLDPQDDRDLRSGDYRFGVPLVYGVGRWQTKLAYYHNSAHLGDEAMLKHPDFPRVNYVRDVLVWGGNVCAQAGWAWRGRRSEKLFRIGFGEDSCIARVRYVLPRHTAANWVGSGRGRKSTRPGADGVVELSPLDFLDRLLDLVPPPRKHRHIPVRLRETHGPGGG